MIDNKVMENYLETLEKNLTQHVAAGSITLRKASDYFKHMSENLFGTGRFNGIAQFLISKPHLKLSPEDAITKAESYIASGWHIAEVSNRFIIMDGSFREVADVTGPRDEEVIPDWELSSETAYVLLKDEDAKKLISLSTNLGIEPASMRTPLIAYQMVKKLLGNNDPMFGTVQNYQGMSEILRRLYSYQGTGESIRDFYDLGYRFADDFNPSSFHRSFIVRGKDKYVLRPVIGIHEPNTHLLVDQVAIQFKNIEKGLFNIEKPLEFAEMGQVYALGFKVDSEFQDYGDIVRVLMAVEDQSKAKTVNSNLRKKLLESLCDIAVYQAVVGNKFFGLEDIAIDSVYSEVTLKYSTKYLSATVQEMESFAANIGTYVATEVTLHDFIGVPFDFSQKHMQNFPKYVLGCSKGFKEKLKSMKFPLKEFKGPADSIIKKVTE